MTFSIIAGSRLSTAFDDYCSKKEYTGSSFDQSVKKLFLDTFKNPKAVSESEMIHHSGRVMAMLLVLNKDYGYSIDSLLVLLKEGKVCSTMANALKNSGHIGWEFYQDIIFPNR